MANVDLARLINSDEVQSVVKHINKVVKCREARKNLLKLQSEEQTYNFRYADRSGQAQR
jgi:hypothetical protein